MHDFCNTNQACSLLLDAFHFPIRRNTNANPRQLTLTDKCRANEFEEEVCPTESDFLTCHSSLSEDGCQSSKFFCEKSLVTRYLGEFMHGKYIRHGNPSCVDFFKKKYILYSWTSINSLFFISVWASKKAGNSDDFLGLQCREFPSIFLTHFSSAFDINKWTTKLGRRGRVLSCVNLTTMKPRKTSTGFALINSDIKSSLGGIIAECISSARHWLGASFDSASLFFRILSPPL